MPCGADGCGPLRRLARRLSGTFPLRARGPRRNGWATSPPSLGRTRWAPNDYCGLLSPDGPGFASMAAEVLDYGERRMRAALGDLACG